MERIRKNSSPEGKVKYTRLKVFSPEEGIIHSKFWDDGFAEEYPYFMCQICLSYVIDPVSCGNCDTIYCSMCLKNYTNFSGNCPNRCKLVIKPMNRILKNLINQLKMDCMFIFKGCKEALKYYDYANHINECEFGPHQCLAPNCYYVDIKSKIITHTKFCEYFNYNRNFQSRVLHSVSVLNNNKLKTVCSYCKKNYNENTILVHSFICDFQLIVCKMCDAKMTLNMYRNHYSKSNSQCLSNQYERRISHLQEKLNYNENLLSIFQNEISEFQKNNNKTNTIDSNKDELKVIKCINIEICRNILSSFSKEYEGHQIQIEESDDLIEVKNLSMATTSTKIIKRNLPNNFIYIHDNNFAICSKGAGIVDYYDLESLSIQESLNISLPDKESINYLLFISENDYNYSVLGTKKGLVVIFQIEKKENKPVYSLTQKLKLFTTTIDYINYYKNKSNKIYLIISAIYNNVKVVQFPTGKFIANLDHRNKSILSFNYMNNYNYLATTTKDSNIRIWQEEFIEGDIPDIYLKVNLKGHHDFVWSLISLDNHTIVSGSGDKTIKIWELENLQQIQTLSGHNDSVTVLEKSCFYDKTLLFSGSYDGEIKIWMFQKSRCDNIYSIYSHKEKIFSLIVKIHHLNNRSSSKPTSNLTIYSSSEDSSIIVNTLSINFSI